MSKILIEREVLESLERLTKALGVGWEDANAAIRSSLAHPAEAEEVVNSKLEKLKAAAKGACSYSEEDWFQPENLWSCMGKGDAAFVSAASPFTLLALIAAYERIRAERDRLDALKKDAERSSAAFNAAISYILGEGRWEEPMEFLRCWNEGDFDSLRKNWPEAPQAIYYADSLADPIVPHREIASTRLVGTNIQMPPETDHDF